MSRKEPDSVERARRVVAEYERKRLEEYDAEKERQNKQWCEAFIGHRYRVSIEGFAPYGSDDRYTASFTARLIAVTRNEGEMHWDNGVITTGVYLDERDRLSPEVGERSGEGET